MAQRLRTRGTQARRILVRDGSRALALRLVRRVERSLGRGRGGLAIGLHRDDIVESVRLQNPLPPETGRTGALRIGWITSPPSPGSGGHTTVLRMVQGLEAAGHECLLALYDAYDGDVTSHEQTLRAHWPGVQAAVLDVRNGLPVVDAWVATSWEMAHVLAARPLAGGHRFYFVQDYEPYFYPRSSEYFLAEDTYRFGFRGITAGKWLADELHDRFDMRCDHFEFGADHDVYRVREGTTRDGVVFYAKPNVARRGYALGLLALEDFARRHPEVPIHLFGDHVSGLGFPAVSHGRVSPATLSEIYNTCRIGLSLSLTNVSLIPWELLACGVIPVVNEADHNRRVLSNDLVAWAPLSPSQLAESMSRAYVGAADPQLASAASASVSAASWRDAADVVTRSIETVCRS